MLKITRPTVSKFRGSVAQAEWTGDRDGRNRKVADEYRNAWGGLELSEYQVKDAVEKAVEQVSWHDRVKTIGLPVA